MVGLGSRTAVSAMNNQFKLSAVAKDITSKESLQGLAQGAAISGLTFGITEATGLGKLTSGMGKLDRFQAIAECGLIHGGVTSLVTGQKLGKTLEAEGRSGLLAMGQSLVGDYAQSKGIADGSLAKIAMHATVGGVYTGVTTGNALSGAIGGGVSEALAPHMSSKSGNMLPGHSCHSGLC